MAKQQHSMPSVERRRQQPGNEVCSFKKHAADNNQQYVGVYIYI